MRFLRGRNGYLVSSIVVIIAGLLSRQLRSSLPDFLSQYAGDTLWGLMVFLLISAIIPSYRALLRAKLSLAVAFAVEFSQLYKASWIEEIRQTTLGGLILGFGFLWSDLVCYSLGIAAGVIMTHVHDRSTNPTQDNSKTPSM